MKVTIQLLAGAILVWCFTYLFEVKVKGIGGAGEAIGAELGSGKGRGPIPGELRIGPCNLSGDCRDE